MKVMVVDDEIEICDFLTTYFMDKGYQVSLATGGEEALSKYERHQPDVVLLDISMTGISGLEVLGELKKKKKSPRVVMITALGDLQAMQKAEQLGAEDYVTKPFDLELLEDRIVE